MSNFTISPNMNLVIPTPGEDPGPDYATNLASDLSIIDGHTHTAGSGVLITTAALNINADLPINRNNLTTVKTVNFSAQSGSLAGVSPNIGCVYVGGNELYYNDEAGNVVQITNTGSVNAGAGSITGLPSGTASASFSAGTFVWQSATNTSANMDFRSAIFRNNVASSKGLTLSPPNAMAADYGLVLPSLPGQTNIMSLDTSGNMGASINVDNSTLQLSGSVLSVKNNGITRAQEAAVGQQVSSSCGTFTQTSSTPTDVTNLTVTITVTGRPVILVLMPDGISQSDINVTIASGTGAMSGNMLLKRASSTIANIGFVGNFSAGVVSYTLPPPGFLYMDVPTSGTYTYKVQLSVDAGNSGSSLQFNNMVLAAYEL